MKEYNLHFYSQTPCNVFINGEQIGFIDNENQFYIDVIVFTPTLIVTCQPLSDNNRLFIPVSFKLDYTNNKLNINNTSIKLVPFPNNNYDVILSFKCAPKSGASLYNKKVGSFNVLAMLDVESTISVFCNDKNLFTTHQQELNNLEAEQQGNLVIVSASANQNKFLLVFNTETKTNLICDTFCKIEKNGDEIKCLKNLNNTLKTGKVFGLNLKTLELNTYNVFIDNFSCTKEQTLIPLSFLEAVKEKNFNFALTFLDEKLTNTTPQKLEQFFGDVNEIYYNSYNLKSDKCNYTIFNPTPHNFDFYLVNGKIADIDEVEL